MSWLLTKGKIYRCTACQKSLWVEYQNSPSLTAIGDMGVEQQLEYSRIFGQPTANPELEGYYIYDFGVCEACYRQSIYSLNPELENIKSQVISYYLRRIDDKGITLNALKTKINRS